VAVVPEAGELVEAAGVDAEAEDEAHGDEHQDDEGADATRLARAAAHLGAPGCFFCSRRRPAQGEEKARRFLVRLGIGGVVVQSCVPRSSRVAGLKRGRMGERSRIGCGRIGWDLGVVAVSGVTPVPWGQRLLPVEAVGLTHECGTAYYGPRTAPQTVSTHLPQLEIHC
jgi:hypothetical protein